MAGPGRKTRVLTFRSSAETWPLIAPNPWLALTARMTFHLHVGAHKTASTHLQATLRKHRAMLADGGVAWHGPDDVRALVRTDQGASARMGAVPSLRRFRAMQRLAQLDANTDRIVASDENSLGRCAEIFRSRALYPTAYDRMRLWRKLSSRRPATVYLAVRDYGAFFSGAYIQAVRNAAFFELSEADKNALVDAARGWVDVVADLRRALPNARIIMWRYEDYEAVRDDLTLRLTGLALAPIRRRPMATPSAAAFAAAAAARKPGEVLSASGLTSATRAYPISTGNPRFSLWAADEAQRLSARYREDVERLRTDLGEDFLGV